MKLSGPMSRDKEKLLKENLFLLDELNKVRGEFDEMKTKHQQLKLNLSISQKFSSANAANKLEQVCLVFGTLLSVIL